MKRLIISLTAVILGAAGLPQAAPPARPPGAADIQHSLELKAKGFGPLLAELAPDGVELRAVKHLTERRITLVVRRASLAELMDWCEELWSLPRYPARWRRKEVGGRPVYELWQDPRAEEELGRLVRADREMLAGRLLDLVGEAQKGLEAPPASGDDEFSRNFLKNKVNWQIGQRAELRMLGEMSPAERESALSGRPPWRVMSSFSEGVVNDLLQGGLGGERMGRRGANGVLVQEDEAAAHARLRGSELGVYMQLDPDGSWWFRLERRGRPGDGVSAYSTRLGDLGISEPEEFRPREGEIDGAPDAAALARVEDVRRDWREMAGFQRFLGVLSDRPILSDYYHHKRPPLARDLKDARTWRQILDGGCRWPGYRWKTSGRAIIFRNRHWYTDDLSEIPVSLEDAIRSELREKGHLDLEWQVRLCRLSDERLGRVESMFPLLSNITAMAPFCRWYDGLPRLQQTQARGTGMLIAESGPLGAALLDQAGLVSILRNAKVPVEEARLSVDHRVENGTAITEWKLAGSQRLVYSPVLKQPLKHDAPVPGF